MEYSNPARRQVQRHRHQREIADHECFQYHSRSAFSRARMDRAGKIRYRSKDCRLGTSHTRPDGPAAAVSPVSPGRPLRAEVSSRNAGGAWVLADCCERRAETGGEHGAPDRDRNKEGASKGLQRTPSPHLPKSWESNSMISSLTIPAWQEAS